MGLYYKLPRKVSKETIKVLEKEYDKKYPITKSITSVTEIYMRHKDANFYINERLSENKSLN